jgi:hypothetical protein
MQRVSRPLFVIASVHVLNRSLRRHARPCAGHPRLSLPSPHKQNVDGRVKPGHDEGKTPFQTNMHFFSAIRRLLIARLPSRTNVNPG